MKQNLPPAKFPLLLITLVISAAILSSFSCATLSRPSPSAAQLSLAVPKTEPGSLVNINTASPQELEKLPGIGRGIAERIVTHRQQYGAFRRAEHLMMVRGISDRKFRELRPMIVIE